MQITSKMNLAESVCACIPQRRPNCVPLQVEAPQASVELDPASKCGRPLALHVITAQVKRLDEDVVAEKPSDLNAPIISDGGVSQTDTRRIFIHL